MINTMAIPLSVVDSLPGHIWSVLSSSDPVLHELPDKGVGEQRGSRLVVRWARDAQARFFVLQVFDAMANQAWEAAVADIGRYRGLAYSRPLFGDCESYVSLWSEAIGADYEPVALKSPPSYNSLLAAFMSEGVPVVVQDQNYKLQVEDDLAYWKGLAQSQAKVIKKLESSLSSVSALALDVGPTNPKAAHTSTPAVKKWRLDEMQEYAALNQDRIVILPRAIAAARRSPYVKPEAVYESLELLAETYRLTKTGLVDRAQLKEHADRLGLSIGGSVNPTNAGEAGDQYYVRWNMRRRFLDQHIGKGSSRSTRFSMRIYYTWCEDSERVIVGWLPSHLDTGRS